MKLPISIVEKDGHIWIRCTHLACMTQREDKGYMHCLDNMQPEANGRKLQEAIEHATETHGAGVI